MSPHEGTGLGITQIIDTIHHSLKIATGEIIDGTERQSGRNVIQCLHFGPNILRRAADATGSSMHQVGTVTFQVRYGVIALHGIASTLASIRAILRLILVAAKIPNLGRAQDTLGQLSFLEICHLVSQQIFQGSTISPVFGL
jgi:hypothetical protein